jgi:NADPH2:quinone reductase
MRAIAIDAYGGQERLQLMDLPIPEIGPDDVLIHVRAAGVNPADISFREGRYAQRVPLSFPAIMGSDFAGTVAQVGAQVTTVREDAQVYGMAWGGGSYAEYLRVPAAGEFAALPASLDVVHAAALPMAGMTALGALDTAALAKGAVLLIVGGAGGIGSFAIQMAAQLGAHVIATARTEDHQYLRSLGAAETIDYTQGNVVEAVRNSHPGGVDAVLDVVSGAAAIGHIAQALRPGGRLLSTVYASDPAQLAERGITAVNIVRPHGAAVLDRLSRMVEAGTLWVPVQATLPLEEAARAQELLQHGHVRGKLVLTIA